jgi:deazaflavin-dependent oxidoreductase (nitroreductase family)
MTRRVGCVQGVLATRPLVVAELPLKGEYEPSSRDAVRAQVEEYEASGGTLANTNATGYPVVIVTYRGAKSGKVRKMALMRVERSGSYLLVGSMGGQPKDPAWCGSIKVHPLVEIQEGPKPHDYVCRELSGYERAEWWEVAITTYPPYAEYQARTSRILPLFVAEPVDRE